MLTVIQLTPTNTHEHTHTQLNMNFSRRWAIKLATQKVVVVALRLANLPFVVDFLHKHTYDVCVFVPFNAPLTMSTQNRIRAKFSGQQHVMHKTCNKKKIA